MADPLAGAELPDVPRNVTQIPRNRPDLAFAFAARQLREDGALDGDDMRVLNLLQDDGQALRTKIVELVRAFKAEQK